MSKKNKKAREEERKRQQASASSQPKANGSDFVAKLASELSATQGSVAQYVESASSASEVTGTTPDPAPADSVPEAGAADPLTSDVLKAMFGDLKGALSACRDAERRFDSAQKGAEEARKRTEEKIKSLAEEREKLKGQRELFERQEEDLKTERDAMVGREERLNQRQKDIDLREEQARAGFIDLWDRQREEHSQRLKRDELAHQSRLEQEKREVDQSRADAARRHRELEVERERIERKEQELSRKERQLLVRENLLEEDQEELAAQAKTEAQAEIEGLKAQLRGEEATIKALKVQCERLQEWKAAKEAAEVERGGKPPDQLADELKAAQSNVQELRAKLRESLPKDQAEELKIVRRQLEDSQKLASTLRADLAEANGQRERLLVQVGETESQAVVFASLRKQNALLADEHKRLQAEIGALMDAHRSDATFEACEKMDQDAEYSAVPPRYHGSYELAHIASTVRHAMAASVGSERYYSEEDVRSFMGGLAMSRLMILQGASGTGKTSLPKAFIKAVAGGLEIIEVQAGWRDRHDLLGTYNAFERRFHERPCLKALYQAGTPLFADKLFFVILDEMNLSPPEYYFADFNSLLESGKDEVELHDRPIDRVPQRVVKSPNKSMVLKLPPNVWFIGTANRDETTSTIAPKTYDRSHVLELPAKHEEFRVERRQRFDAPVRFSELCGAFTSAGQEHEGRVDEFIEALDSVAPSLATLGVRPSPRFRSQASRYIPVVIACGGSLAEAADYLLTYRVLQPVADRFGVSKKALEALRDEVADIATSLGGDRTKWKAVDLLNKKLAAMSGADDEG